MHDPYDSDALVAWGLKPHPYRFCVSALNQVGCIALQAFSLCIKAFCIKAFVYYHHFLKL